MCHVVVFVILVARRVMICFLYENVYTLRCERGALCAAHPEQQGVPAAASETNLPVTDLSLQLIRGLEL